MRRLIARGLVLLATSVGVYLIAAVANAQRLKDIAGGTAISDKPIIPMISLSALALVPLFIIMVTSFVKITVILTIVRQALGTTNVPPTIAIAGIAMVMTVYVMAPTGLDVYHNGRDRLVELGITEFDVKKIEPTMAAEMVGIAQAPLRLFLAKHAHRNERTFFYDMSRKMRSGRDAAVVTPDDFPVLIPAFVMSELIEAFIIGFLIFLPMLAVDMVIANILMALGMQMLSPSVVALPFKILVFVTADGWHMIAKGLVLGYE